MGYIPPQKISKIIILSKSLSLWSPQDKSFFDNHNIWKFTVDGIHGRAIMRPLYGSIDRRRIHGVGVGFVAVVKGGGGYEGDDDS